MQRIHCLCRYSRMLATAFCAVVCCHSYAASINAVANFSGSNGALPFAGLLADGSGNYYGTTQSGGSGSGTLFKFIPASNSVMTLAVMDNSAKPYSRPIADASGNLFGTTSLYGGNGSVYELPVGQTSVTTLGAFNATNGSMPQGGLVADAAGNLYGTTNLGGSTGGTVFKIDAATRQLSILTSFTTATGINPAATLYIDRSGNLFGTAANGGANGFGTLFEYVPSTNQLTSLASFTSANGRNPASDLVADAAGNLYGTTEFGGTTNDGVIFKFDINTHALTSLASLTSATTGANPKAGLLEDAAGNFFGVTVRGGSQSDGTVFELSSSGVLTSLGSLNGGTGANSYGTLVPDAVGNLYGTAVNAGANNDGTIFEVTGSGFVVPEPASFGTVGLLVSVVTLRRRRKSKTFDHITP